MMERQELFHLYWQWTKDLHIWCATKLGRHVDALYEPANWTFTVYSGSAEVELNMETGIPIWVRPQGEDALTIKLPRPEDHPNADELNRTFRQICIATAIVLKIELSRTPLGLEND